MSARRPIGIFDSGLGGLTVVRAVSDLLPNESIVYFGDTARWPYGPRPLREIHDFALQICDFLAAQECKIVVVGCNSASAALQRLGRPELGVPLIDVVEPPSLTAAAMTRNRRVGVIGTEATVSSGAYEEALRRWSAQQVHVVSRACPRFVEFAELGETYSTRVLDVAAEYLEPVRCAGVDTLILGCTHYPLLIGPIGSVMGPEVLLVSSAEEAARDVYRVLRAGGMLRTDPEPASSVFYTSGDPEQFRELGYRFIGPALSVVKQA